MPQEYKLKSSTAEFSAHHIAKLNIPQFDISQCRQPVRLFRGQPASLPINPTAAAMISEAAAKERDVENSGMTAEQLAEQELKKKMRMQMFMKKTRVYYDSGEEYKEARALRKREALPWILEDALGDTSFVGKLEPGQNQNYVLFVFEEGGFTVVPTQEWYKFNQRITYRTLTVDEAEEQMKSKSVSSDRWMMHKMKMEGVVNADSEQNTLFASSGRQPGDVKVKVEADEILYEEDFQDDEEYGQNLNDGEDKELEETRKQKQEQRADEDIEEIGVLKKKNRRRDDGKDTKRLLKKMKQDFFDSDEEERDAWGLSEGEELSTDGEESSDDDKEKKKPDEREPGLVGIMPKARVAGSSSSLSSSGKQKPTSRPGSPAASFKLRKVINLGKSSGSSSDSSKRRQSVPNSRDSSPQLQSDSASDSAAPSSKKMRLAPAADGAITQDEVVALFKAMPNRRIAAKDVIAKLKKKLRQDPVNLPPLLKEIIQRVSIKSVDNLLELRPEY